MLLLGSSVVQHLAQSPNIIKVPDSNLSLSVWILHVHLLGPPHKVFSQIR